MSFDDLPDDWPVRSLEDPRLAADVFDLVLSLEDRQGGALGLLLCDASGRLVTPGVMSLEGADDGDRAVATRRSIELATQTLAGHAEGAGLVVAIARADGLSLTAEDRRVAAEAGEICAAAGMRLLGVHVVTVDGSRVVPMDRRAA